MPWGSDAQSRQSKPPVFIDISPGLTSPRVLNVHDMPSSDGPDTVGNSNLYYKTEDICDMMREIRTLIADGERVIEKRKQWNHTWFPATIYGCLLGYPVVFWSDSIDSDRTCLPHGAKVWDVEWTDGEARRPVYSFCVPHSLMTSNLKAYLQRWTDSIFDRTLPHQNYYLLQSLSTFDNVML
jgi:Domain of unknown function (DUF4504)